MISDAAAAIFIGIPVFSIVASPLTDSGMKPTISPATIHPIVPSTRIGGNSFSGFDICASDIEFVSAVGSGDALAAAFIYALDEGKSVAQALRLGVGAGAAHAMTFGAGFCTREDLVRLAEETEITQSNTAAW